MNCLTVIAKKNGILIPCRPQPAPDGFAWVCGACQNALICRVSFGIMNGVWRCRCAAEIEICVDGVPIDLHDLSIEARIDVGQGLAEQVYRDAAVKAQEAFSNVVPFPKRITDKDKEFLEACNIALDEDGDELA